MRGLQGRTYIVTGAASGIGRATMTRLMDEGAIKIRIVMLCVLDCIGEHRRRCLGVTVRGGQPGPQWQHLAPEVEVSTRGIVHHPLEHGSRLVQLPDVDVGLDQ